MSDTHNGNGVTMTAIVPSATSSLQPTVSTISSTPSMSSSVSSVSSSSVSISSFSQQSLTVGHLRVPSYNGSSMGGHRRVPSATLPTNFPPLISLRELRRCAPRALRRTRSALKAFASLKTPISSSSLTSILSPSDTSSPDSNDSPASSSSSDTPPSAASSSSSSSLSSSSTSATSGSMIGLTDSPMLRTSSDDNVAVTDILPPLLQMGLPSHSAPSATDIPLSSASSSSVSSSVVNAINGAFNKFTNNNSNNNNSQIVSIPFPVNGSDTPLSTPRSNLSGPLAPIVEVNTPNVSSAASMAPLAAAAAAAAAAAFGNNDGLSSFVLGGNTSRLQLDDELSSFGALRLSDNDDVMSPLAPQRDQPFIALMSPAPRNIINGHLTHGGTHNSHSRNVDSVHTETTTNGDSVKISAKGVEFVISTEGTSHRPSGSPLTSPMHGRSSLIMHAPLHVHTNNMSSSTNNGVHGVHGHRRQLSSLSSPQAMLLNGDGGSEDSKNGEGNVVLRASDLAQVAIVGRGQHGPVLKALHLPSMSFIALKRINASRLSARPQLIQELHAYAKLSSPYLVSLLGAYFDAPDIILASELMDCGSLRSFVRTRGKLKEPLVKHITRQFVLGLDYLHKNQMVHRDIKPDNVLLNHHGHVKISDFGLLKELDDGNMAKTFLGTLFYLSPERIQSAKYSYPSDIWSLGLCVLYAAAGSNPLEPAEERGQVRAKVATPASSNVSPANSDSPSSASAVPTTATGTGTGTTGTSGANNSNSNSNNGSPISTASTTSANATANVGGHTVMIGSSSGSGSRGTPPGGNNGNNGSHGNTTIGQSTDYGFWPTMERIVRQPPLALSPDDGYSPELCDFIAACLVKDPMRRASTSQLLAHPFLKDVVDTRRSPEWKSTGNDIECLRTTVDIVIDRMARTSVASGDSSDGELRADFQLDVPRLRLLEEQFDIGIDRIKNELKDRLRIKCAAATTATAATATTVTRTATTNNSTGITGINGADDGSGHIPGVNIGNLRDEEAEEKAAQIARRARERSLKNTTNNNINDNNNNSNSNSSSGSGVISNDGIVTPGGHYRTHSATATYIPDDGIAIPAPLHDMTGIPVNAINAALYDPLSPEPVIVPPSSLSSSSQSMSMTSSVSAAVLPTVT